MSKTKATQTSDAVADSQPPYIAELLLNGTVTLTAKTREELAEMVNDIPADCKYGAGAVGKLLDGSGYVLQVHLIKD
jgi:hypothetical protein